MGSISEESLFLIHSPLCSHHWVCPSLKSSSAPRADIPAVFHFYGLSETFGKSSEPAGITSMKVAVNVLSQVAGVRC